jgi:aryl-alcohol dehydrogenase-like predicted oxidoreductase
MVITVKKEKYMTIQNSYSDLILGTVQLGQPYGHGLWRDETMPESEAYRILDIAWENGINTVDTSPEYGLAEKRLVIYLKRNPQKQFHVISKIRNLPNESYALEKKIEDYFKNSPFALLTNCLSFSLLLHSENDLYRNDVLRMLEIAKNEGQISKWGVSVYSHKAATFASDVAGCSIVQAPYGFLNQSLGHSGVLETIYRNKRLVHARSIFNRGLFFAPLKELSSYGEGTAILVRNLRNFLQENNISPVNFALSFALSQPFVSSIVTGFDSVEQIAEFAKAKQESVVPEIPKELVLCAQSLFFSY